MSTQDKLTRAAACFRTRRVAASCRTCGVRPEVVHCPLTIAGFFCGEHCPACTPAPKQPEVETLRERAEPEARER